MTTLAADKKRAYGEVATYNDIPVIADDIIYEGAAVGDNGSGLARPLVSNPADPFMGFAARRVDNAGGAASAKKVRLMEEGYVEIPVVGAASAADQGEPVYASDDDTFTLTSTNNSAIGKVERWVTGTTCIVFFQSVSRRSI